MALIMVLGGLTVLTVMLTEFQQDTSASFASALTSRDQIKAEYAARSGLNLSRLLIAAEPTIRKAIAPLFLLMRRPPPQIPVWTFADQVLGAFNDKDGAEQFQKLATVSLEDGEKLGLEGAGFSLKIVDEDSKININQAARGDAFSQQRLATAIYGLIGSPQYNPMFENRDADGQFTDRQALCAAIIDWVDPDQNTANCAPNSDTAQATAPEDSFYQLLKDPYPRKNAAFDSLEELRLVRGIDDDFWTTFVEPEPYDHEQRTLTVWGQGKVNVNTANPQTLWALTCGNAVEGTLMCTDPAEASKFLMSLGMLRNLTQGAPLFGTPKGYVNALAGKGMFGSVMAMMEIQPVQLKSVSEFQKLITTKSKVFSIVVDGYVKFRKRETHVRLHAVVDFLNAPPPGVSLVTADPDASRSGVAPPGSAPTATASAMQDLMKKLGERAGSGIPKNLPEGASEEALMNAFRPNPAGKVVYYRVE